MREITAGEPKHVIVDRCVNSAIEQLVTICNRADGVRDYAELAVVGYGGRDREAPTLRSLLPTTSGAWTAPLSAVAEMATVVDDRAQYVTSVPNGWTPMGAAIRLAGRLVSDWLVEHPDSPAPVIVNVTDGLPTDDDAAEGPVDEWAKKLEQLATTDGSCLLINVNAGAFGVTLDRCIFPAEGEVPDSEGATRLWGFSSNLPEELVSRAARLGLIPQTAISDGRKLYAQGTDETLLERIFDFGTEVRPH